MRAKQSQFPGVRLRPEGQMCQTKPNLGRLGQVGRGRYRVERLRRKVERAKQSQSWVAGSPRAGRLRQTKPILPERPEKQVLSRKGFMVDSSCRRPGRNKANLPRRPEKARAAWTASAATRGANVRNKANSGQAGRQGVAGHRRRIRPAPVQVAAGNSGRGCPIAMYRDGGPIRVTHASPLLAAGTRSRIVAGGVPALYVGHALVTRCHMIPVAKVATIL